MKDDLKNGIHHAKLRFALLAVLSGLALRVPISAQEAPPASQKSQAARNAATAESKPLESSGVLAQLNTALQDLAAKVSPAVVQILVTGYGTAREQDRSAGSAVDRP